MKKSGKANGMKNQNEALVRTCGEQRRRIRDMEAGQKELSFVVDSVLACVALQYGEPDAEKKKYKLRFPMGQFYNVLTTHFVRTHKDVEKDEYVVCVEKKERG